jgi:preprotein translocase SecE subunit
MARDRQRAKQRRRRQPGGAGPTGPARTRPREPDVEDSASTVFPQRGDVAPVEGPEDFELEQAAVVEPAPDELDPAVTEEREEREHVRPGRRRSRGRIITFLGHVIDELRRVQWPDRRHVGQGTAVVLGFVVIAGTYLGLLDALWKPLIEAIL